MTKVTDNAEQLSIKDVQVNCEHIFNDVLVNGEPFKISRDADNALRNSEDVWSGMTAMLNLLSIPGMRESVRPGMYENIADTRIDLDW